MKLFRKLIWLAVSVFFIGLFSIWAVEKLIEKNTGQFIYPDSELIPYNKVGLLLGTAKSLQNGAPNLYFVYRVDAAVRLFKEGKINYLVISGDNSRKEYNEPEDMKDELIKRGIPESKLYLDYAGFRTYDSIVRMQKIFGQTSFTVISQKFHVERAIYLARSKNLKVVGFAAQEAYGNADLKVKLREKFARVKAVLDLVLGKEPKFLGEPIIIE